MSAASALLQRKDSRGGLWGFEIPSNLLKFTKQDSIPCGVMVVLGMIAEIDTPKWQTEEEEHDVLKNTTGQSGEDEQNGGGQIVDNGRHERRTNGEGGEAERRIKDAIASPKMGNKAAAEASLAWLIDKAEVGREWRVANLAEAVLYLMAVDQRSDG
jgi:hypothetical protein